MDLGQALPFCKFLSFSEGVLEMRLLVWEALRRQRLSRFGCSKNQPFSGWVPSSWLCGEVLEQGAQAVACIAGEQSDASQCAFKVSRRGNAVPWLASHI